MGRDRGGKEGGRGGMGVVGRGGALDMGSAHLETSSGSAPAGLIEQWHKRSGGLAAAVELLRWGCVQIDYYTAATTMVFSPQ